LAVWAAVSGVVMALAAAPPATASPAGGSVAASARAAVPDGVYGITFRGEEESSLTQESDDPGSPTVLLPPLGEPGYQEWALVRDSRTTQIIRNVRNGLYLGLNGGQPGDHRLVVVSANPFSWHVRTGSTPDRVTITVPGNVGYRLDRSPLLVHPPQVDIQLPRNDGSQEWELTPHE
ncbi:MAG: hypothetical protein HOV94_06590, partial [Saccharothrix sp.]|nr:hypothetical protein [Saccharothrix sp.]